MKSIKKEYSNRIVYKNKQGYLHREYKPAREWNNGDKEWFNNGKLHREDGPALVYGDGSKEWYLNGKKYSEDEWKQEVINIKLKRILDL